MKETYPSLYWWKKQGFKKFPTIPLTPIVKILEKTFKLCIVDYIDGVDNISIAKTPLENPLEYSLKEIQRRLVLKTARILSNAKVKSLNEAIEKAMRHLSYIIGCPSKPLDRLMYNFLEYEIKQLFQDQYIMWGKMVADAREKIINGEKRAKVLSELGDKVLPQTKGGPSIFTRDELEALSFVYGEMKLCIKEIKQSLNLPLQKVSLSEDEFNRNFLVGEDPIHLAKEMEMKIIEIFNHQEIPLVLANRRISDISADIIVSRLNQCRYSNITSPRTLQDILHSFTPTFAE